MFVLMMLDAEWLVVSQFCSLPSLLLPVQTLGRKQLYLEYLLEIVKMQRPDPELMDLPLL